MIRVKSEAYGRLIQNRSGSEKEYETVKIESRLRVVKKVFFYTIKESLQIRIYNIHYTIHIIHKQ